MLHYVQNHYCFLPELLLTNSPRADENSVKSHLFQAPWPTIPRYSNCGFIVVRNFNLLDVKPTIKAFPIETNSYTANLSGYHTHSILTYMDGLISPQVFPSLWFVQLQHNYIVTQMYSHELWYYHCYTQETLLDNSRFFEKKYLRETHTFLIPAFSYRYISVKRNEMVWLVGKRQTGSSAWWRICWGSKKTNITWWGKSIENDLYKVKYTSLTKRFH